VEAGSGPLVVLLHGFPEFWYSWRHQIPALAAAGYRVVAPDLRGYNLSEKPPGVGAYSMRALVGDVVALARAAGAEQFHLVGHDWGGAVAWAVARHYPGALDRLVILNAPHPAAFLRELTGSLHQVLRSWYILFFQLPVLPEIALSAFDFLALDRVFGDPSVVPGSFSPRDVRFYKQALGRPGALTATIDYYRAAVRGGPGALKASGDRTIERPTLLVWGEDDPYLGVNLTRGLDAWVRHLSIRRIPGTGHWVQNERPELVNRMLVDFLRGREPGAA
jgi:pimeloyl-ACP methyl ester carboxylesterase